MLAFAIPFPNIGPDIFSIELGGFTLALRWYALAYIAGILIGWRLILHALKKPQIWRNDTAPMSAAQMEDLLTWIILGIILGGRLGFVVFYQPAYYLSHPVEIPMVWQGGMSFHGGFLGVVLAVWLFLKLFNLLVAVIRFLNGDETAITRYFDRNRERKGFQALADGLLEGCAIECPFHAGTFDVRTGEALTRPCVDKIKSYPVKIEDDIVYVLVNETAPA